jgi:hypothetical protein
MDRAEDYRKRAEEAEESARRAAGELERDAYSRIAQGWRDLEASARRGLNKT